MERTWILPLLLVAVVLTAGCATFGGAGDAGPSGGGGDGMSAPAESGGDAGGGDGGDAGDREQADLSGRTLQTDRQIVRTGTVELEVDDFEATRREITDRARSLGGYVGGSSSTRHTRENDSWTTGYVVVRVPSEEFSTVLLFARDRGTVLDEETETTDVTDQLVDLEARLTNLKERRDRLRSFYERANTTQELLRIEETLSGVQERIESLQARKRSLEDRVALATLRVELREPAPETTPTPDEDATGTSLVSALSDSTATLLGSAYEAVLFGVRLVPWLVFVGLPAVALFEGVRRRYGPVTLRPWSSDTRDKNRKRTPDSGTAGTDGSDDTGDSEG